MWRTVIVTKGEKMTVKNNWLVVFSGKTEQSIPIGDIYSVVIDNRAALLSVSVITELTEAGVHILFCDNSHIPTALALPLNNHYRPLEVIERQIALTDEFKDLLWQRIVQQKIKNQAKCLKLCGINKDKIELIGELAKEVLPGDSTNREAVAAKKYFSALFGCTFRRSTDDITNSALNYGYSIIRSAVSKTLVAYGYNCTLGIHHIGKQNPFNLADDMMEPLRPLVDLWTDNACDELWDKLTKTNRNELINLVNVPVMLGNKKTRVRYAIDKYVSSLTSAIRKQDSEQLVIPELIQIEYDFEDDEDG